MKAPSPAASIDVSFPTDRTAIVSGAGSERGIGRALAERLCREGWAVAALDVDADAVQNVALELSSRGYLCIGVGMDVGDRTSVDEAITRVERDLPPVVGLANIAGVSSPVNFLELTDREWERVFRVNSTGPYLLAQRILPTMIGQSLGRIVNVSSVSAQRGGGTYSKVAYSASKAAILGFTRALAREFGREGITVNAVSPGPIDTDIMGGPLTPERKSELLADLVVPRVGTVDDVAALMAYLLGPDAGYITGATYNINGGLIID